MGELAIVLAAKAMCLSQWGRVCRILLYTRGSINKTTERAQINTPLIRLVGRNEIPTDISPLRPIKGKYIRLVAQLVRILLDSFLP